MPLLPTIGRTVGTGVRAMRMLVRGGLRGSAWATRRVGDARARGAAGEIGMIRLFDLHALSCAGDTLIAIGLAGTIFFNVPLGEARSKVALYLLVTMVPFALLAPVVGPLLDHFRHGRRYALAAAMLGRAFLAYVISDNLLGWGLYPAAFGVLALSRAYGVARSAAVPRLLPEGVGLSQVGARASVYGTFAGAVVAPIGLLAFKIGPQWPLRVSSIIFLVGMVIALRLPPRADSDPPEEVPRPFRTMLRLRRGPDRPLSGSLVVGTLIGSASFRCLYGFLLLYLAFAVKAQGLGTDLFGRDIGSQGAVALVGGALAVGTFLATAIGTRLRIRRPAALQSGGLTITAAVAVLTAIFFTLPMVALLSLVASVFSGIAKLAVDASIQERVPERLRASAFAHSETVLMIAWVIGGAVGIIPLHGRLGITLAALFAVAAAVRGTIVATRLHGERLHGRPDVAAEEANPPEQPTAEHPTTRQPTPEPSTTRQPTPEPSTTRQPTPEPSTTRQPTPEPSTTRQPTAEHPTTRQPTAEHPTARSTSLHPASQLTPPHGIGAQTASDPPAPPPRKPTGRRRRLFSRTGTPASEPLPTQPWGSPTPPAAPTPPPAAPTPPPAASTPPPAASTPPPAASTPPPAASTPPAGAPTPSPATAAPSPERPATPEQPRDDLAPPGFHIYRPSSAANSNSSHPDEAGR
ncbi:MFS transporter [Couchioplanes azureus]|uniref:MFS transporter n=1 Tax=Couchioplanes caeruleus TaxID=56438 RepID=UPI00167052CE|nr:MFS transporter [Couchioplanes caeruleus]